MHVKAILALILIFVIVGLMVVTDVGRKYAELFSKTVGALISSVTKYGQPTGERFEITLKTNFDALLGQSFKVSNSTITASGVYNYMKMDSGTLDLKEGKRIDLIVNNMKGTLEITSAGSIVITADSDYIEIDNLRFLGNRKIEIEFIPKQFYLSDLIQDKIILNSATGSIKRATGEQNIENSKIEIYGFVGTIKMNEDGSLEMVGLVTGVKGDKFDWR